MPSIHRLAVPLILVAAVAVSGCARQISPNVVEGPAVGEVMRTYTGMVRSARFVEVQDSDTLDQNRTGQIIGGLAGGVAGSRIGGGLGKAIAIGAGALIGAAIGSVAEQEAKRQLAAEYVIELDNGELLTVVQGTVPEILPGDRVFVQQSARGRSRVVRG